MRDLLLTVVEEQRPDLHMHSAEVSRLCREVAARLGMTAKEIDLVGLAAELHDIGKVAIPDSIVGKAGPLDATEWELMKTHPLVGERLLASVRPLRPLAPIVRSAHERWDGAGYPDGLAAEQIPLASRVITACDAYDAMISDRPYAHALTSEEALAELERNAGTQFDPRIVQLFTDEVRKRPPSQHGETPVEAAFADPEIGARRNGTEPRIGQAAAEIVDSQTLLYSHRFLHEVADSEAARAEIQDAPFALVMVELDDLPEINSEDGFAAGDAALRDAALVLQEVAARCEGTPARYSGRRLALLVPRAEAHAARDLAAEIVARLEAQGRRVRGSAAVWDRGESGADVVMRSRLALATLPTGAAQG